MRSSIWMVMTVAVGLATGTGLAQQGSRAPASSARVTPAETTTRIVAAAHALLRTLDDAGRAKVQFPFDGPQKTRWSNLPSRASFSARGCGWVI